MLSFPLTITHLGISDARERPAISGNMNPPVAGLPIPIRERANSGNLPHGAARIPAAQGCGCAKHGLHAIAVVCL